MADDGFAFLAEVFHEHTSRVTEAAAKSLRLDFGEILEDYSLKPNTYDVAVPKEAWMVCRQLTLGATNAHLTWTVSAGHPGDGTHSHGPSGEHSHSGGRHPNHPEEQGGGEHTHSGDGQHVHTNEGPHAHSVLVPGAMRGVQPGDRVLMAWVGRTPVVIDIILPATTLGGNG